MEEDCSFYQRALKAKKHEEYDKYVSILQEGLKNNDAECIYLLGQCYEYGWYINRDQMKALKLYKKNSNHPKSMCKVASELWKKYNDIRFERIIRIILKSSDHFAKGYCMLKGIGIKDDIKGFEEMLVSAEEGDAEGQYHVAFCFENGYGVDQNQTKAYEWFLKSSNQGYPLSQYRLANYFHYCIEVPKDYEKSLYWYRKYFKSSGICIDLQNILQISKKVKECELDSLINLKLARCYLSGKKVRKKNDFLSWFFYKKTKEIKGKQELKQLEETVFKEFNTIFTLLCIGKFSKYPKEVFMLIGKEIFGQTNIWTNKAIKKIKKNF
jgi:TPR repeat protein